MLKYRTSGGEVRCLQTPNIRTFTGIIKKTQTNYVIQKQEVEDTGKFIEERLKKF